MPDNPRSKTTEAKTERMFEKRHRKRNAADRMIKVACILCGGTSAALTAAVLVPSGPVITGIATVLGLIGSGLVVRKYG
ncbi:hypothetical protein [Cupriavidus plantarum]|uniref:hypothetical protein n=1 Tax=Cupriavidus plantarum TaxID=942865 RepID=UPI001B16C7FB|nr:hypothetical protein [Cupriavidus plantarum]CAG2128931.1 hypothetical protein LMG26296_01472 [Cupriavidus plantarum]SMR66394.1 hypothetical protein SAMN05421735_1275 [Cupriavidus plantarum]